jgi:hypothetical protein
VPSASDAMATNANPRVDRSSKIRPPADPRAMRFQA